MRKFTVSGKNKTSIQKTKKTCDDKDDNTDLISRNQSGLIAPLTWAQRLRRVFNIDVTVCLLCGGTKQIIADITDPDIIQKILDHIEAQPPPVKPTVTVSHN